MTNLASQIEHWRTAPLDQLADEYARLHGHPPRSRRKRWLWKRIAWRLQADAHGGLSTEARQRLSDLAVALDLPTEMPKASTIRQMLPGSRRRGGLTPGTVLTRVWHDKEYRVDVLDRGFVCEGVTYRSLSAVATAISGSHWNGRLFFGLTKRSRDR
jgi:hypothetical protein